MAIRRTKEKFPTTQILGVVAGSVAAGMVEKLVSKFLPTASPTVKALVPVAAGVFLAMQKNAIVKGAGFGMVAAGGSALVNAFMPAGAVGNVDDLFISEMDEINAYDDYLNAPADQSILSAPADQSILSGIDEDGMFGEEEMLNAYYNEGE
jgi:hypothetical protein